MPNVTSRKEWLSARLDLLKKEKQLTQQLDALAQERRQLPLVSVEKDYRFETNDGKKTLLELFNGSKQLIVYHFMFGPDWEQGCPSCSFWADNFNGIDKHLKARDTQLIAASNAALETINTYKDRLGWAFEWVSAGDNTFSADFAVSFYDGDQSELQQGYNYSGSTRDTELPGISIFHQRDDGTVAHSYSSYARGLESANAAYSLLDMTPLGRNEDALPWPMAWVKRHDEY